jgi:protein-tyrosine-phosphatase
MLKQSCKAFNELNAELARSTMLIADQMEHNLDMVYTQMMSTDVHDQVKDAFATFVVFTQLKRAADQAKNICEDTVFAATGNQKSPKVYRVLFVDESNSLMSQMAEAIARNSFPESGIYSSAGQSPAADIDPDLAAFLETRMSEFSGRTSSTAQITPQQLAEQTVIISLQGPVESYFKQIPFHTAVLEWEIPEGDVETLYREIAPRVNDLMILLRGEGAG